MVFRSIIFVSATIFVRLLSGLPATEVRFQTPCQTPNNQPSYCIEIKRCQILFEQILKNNSESYDFIRASHCGPRNEDPNNPKVCCGTYNNYIDKIAVLTTTSPRPPPPPSSSSSSSQSPSPSPSSSFPGHPLPKKCGVPEVALNNRIFGGSDAELDEFPWMVRLKHINTFNFSSYGCAGFLIHRRFVLTAAHCIDAEALKPLGPLAEVVLGSHSEPEPCINYDSGKECNEPLTVKVDKIIVHRNYEPLQHLHDIALIRLRERVEDAKNIKPICLSYNSTGRSELWLSGWGRTEKDATSSVKQKVSVPRVDINTCAEKYRALNMNIQNTQICAGGISGRDSCTGDSGGPLMAQNENKQWYAEGIVSYGTGCGRQNWPGVYTYLPKYINWIMEKINSFRQKRNQTVIRA